jgi:membrane-associated protease RseP (regulator of RpoE activity)
MDSPRRWPWLNAALLVATVASTLYAGAKAAVEGDPSSALELVRRGWPYSAALLSILTAHEAGHYLLARRHGVDTTLPYFIPFPFGFGTFGAVMRLRTLPPSRRATLDIGVAGPLAGAAVALPLLLWGLAHSTLVDSGALVRAGIDSPWQLLQAWGEGRPLGEGGAMQTMGDSLLTWGAQRLVWGELPPGKDLLLHPVAFAAWLGLLVTALNLVPLGQLDGGHLTFAWLGRERAQRLSRLVSWALLGCGLTLSWNWLVWWLLTRLAVGLRHPPTWDEGPLDRPRTALALLGLLLFLLTFVPVPFSI